MNNELHTFIYYHDTNQLMPNKKCTDCENIFDNCTAEVDEECESCGYDICNYCIECCIGKSKYYCSDCCESEHICSDCNKHYKNLRSGFCKRCFKNHPEVVDVKLSITYLFSTTLCKDIILSIIKPYLDDN